MERLSAYRSSGALAATTGRLAWELCRGARAISRRVGLFGWALAGVAACAGAGLGVERRMAHRLEVLGSVAPAAPAGAVHPAAAPDNPAARAEDTRHARLDRFDAQLTPHADIPLVVQDLLEMGAAEGLSMLRGTYVPQYDAAGGFLRYSMSLPVRGMGAAIQRFLQAALFRHPSLALDSVHFSRDRSSSSEVEARIVLVLVVRPPAGTLAVAARGSGQ
jgi:hypothetical protein